MLSADRFAAETGVELLEISPGYAKARMKVTEKHLKCRRSLSGRCIVYIGRFGILLWPIAVDV